MMDQISATKAKAKAKARSERARHSMVTYGTCCNFMTLSSVEPNNVLFSLKESLSSSSGVVDISYSNGIGSGARPYPNILHTSQQ